MADISDLKLIDYEFPVGNTGIIFVAALQGYFLANGVGIIDDHQIRWGWHRAASTLAFMGLISGETFRFLRESLPLTEVEAATLLGADVPSIQAWEAGILNVPITIWQTLAHTCSDVDQRPGSLYMPAQGMDFRPRRIRIVPDVPGKSTAPVIPPTPCSC